jgi:hypothetical protein
MDVDLADIIKPCGLDSLKVLDYILHRLCQHYARVMEPLMLKVSTLPGQLFTQVQAAHSLAGETSREGSSAL